MTNLALQKRLFLPKNLSGSLGGALGPPTRLFFVGAPGNTSDAAHYSRTSGGAGGAGKPNANVDVIIDGNSGSGTITVDAAFTAKSLTLNNSAITLLDNVGMTVIGLVTFTAGTPNTNGQTENWGSFTSNGAVARTLTITNSVINLNSPTAIAWTTATATNLTLNSTGSTINITGFSSTFTPGAQVLPNVVFNGGGAVTASTGSYGNLSVLGNNSILFDNLLNAGTITATGTFTVTAFAQNNPVFVIGGAAPPSRVITAANVSLFGVQFRNITGAGAATWAGTSVGDLGGNTGITFTTPVTLYRVQSGPGVVNWSIPANWSLASGGAPANRVPYPQDTALFDANSFSAPSAGLFTDFSSYPNMDWTGVTNNPNLIMGEGGVPCGNVTLSPNMTTQASQTLLVVMAWYKFNENAVLTTNGVPFAAGLATNCPGGTLTLGSDLVQVLGAKSTIGLEFAGGGTLNNNGFNMMLAGLVIDFSTTARGWTMGSGVVTLQYPFGTIWNLGSFANFTLNAAGSTVKVKSPNPTGPRTFAGFGKTFNIWQWAAEGISSILSLTGANTITTLQVDADTVARTFTLPAGVTTTTTTASLNGASGTLLTVNSSTPGTQATIAGTVTASYAIIKDSHATGSATATNSIDGGNNTGWTFQ